MSKLQPLDQSRHGHLRLAPQNAIEALQGQHLIPLFDQELPIACAYMPVVFAKDVETGKFSPAGLAGLTPGENLFCHKDQWQLPFRPLSAQRLAVIAVATESNDEQLMLCVRDDLKNLDSEHGEPLFTDSGQQSEALQAQAKLAAQQHNGAVTTKKLIDALLKYGLLNPTTINVELPDESAYDLSGLYVLNEQRFNELADDALLELKENGHLAAIFATIFSQQRLNDLLMHKQNEL